MHLSVSLLLSHSADPLCAYPCLSSCLHLPCVFSVFPCLGLSHPRRAQAIRLRVHPLYLMIPATVGCSYAFMLPVSTPPNSIAFASGHLLVRDMVSLWAFSSRGPERWVVPWGWARHRGRAPTPPPNIFQFLNRSFWVGAQTRKRNISFSKHSGTFLTLRQFQETLR